MMLPQAPSSDTTGSFAREAETSARVSRVMLGEDLPGELPKTFIVSVDAFGFPDDDVQAALEPRVSRLARLIGSTRGENLASQGLSVWARGQRTLQPVEAWATFRPWVEGNNPRMALAAARNLIAGADIPTAERAWAALMRSEARARLRHLLADGAIACLPTTPLPAPPKGQAIAALDLARSRITCLTAHGGLAGVPQVSIPGAAIDGLPVGLSIIGAHSQNGTLVAVAKGMEEMA